MHATGHVLTESEPDYVVLGETRTYAVDQATTKAIRLIDGGADRISTRAESERYPYRPSPHRRPDQRDLDQDRRDLM